MAKEKANALFKDGKFGDAVEWYDRAIALDGCNAIYYANRAFAHIKLEKLGAAIADATQAIELNPKYVKGYYRRGDAQFAMGHFKQALIDLKKAAQVAPKDPDLRRKMTLCEKAYRTQKFEEALSTDETPSPPVSETIDLDEMKIDDSYKGPQMKMVDGAYVLTLEFVEDMMKEFKEQRVIHKRFAFEIILQARRIFKTYPSLVHVDVPVNEHFTVCGDIHGQYYDLLNIFELNGKPSDTNPYLFNGDFVDRGSFSVEVIITLLAFKCLYPDFMHLTRGNHETTSMNKIYGFEGEVKHKYSATMVDVFRETFCHIPLAYVLKQKVLVLHGGLFSRDDVTIAELESIDRNKEPPESGVMCEVLWSDPHPLPGRRPSQRGVGIAFGPDVSKKFLDDNNLDLLVRSHEVKDEGYEMTHDGRVITVFSAPNYCDSMGNKGAFLRFEGADMVPKFTQFQAVSHPDVRPMAYANSFMFGM